MKVVVKVRFNSSKEKFEAFGNNKFLLYLPFEQDAGTAQFITEMLSRRLGTPSSRIEFIAVDVNKDWVFDIN